MVEYQVGQINSYNGDTQVHNFEINKDLSDIVMGNDHIEGMIICIFDNQRNLNVTKILGHQEKCNNGEKSKHIMGDANKVYDRGKYLLTKME